MSPETYSLIHTLADGEFHSGESLGALLGVSRAAVWKRLQSLEAYGLYPERLRGKGYRLVTPLDLLDASLIQCALDKRSLNDVVLKVLPELGSTNAYLMERASGASSRLACLVEFQTAGRGRRGRSWRSGFASDLTLSFTQPFSQGVAAMEGLSLAIGLGLVEALEGLGAQYLGLKWPNDVLISGRKLAGILIEIQGDAAGDCQAVVGIGVNVRCDPNHMSEVDQPWTDLRSVGINVSRSVIAAEILARCLGVTGTFEKTGFAPYLAAWERRCPHIGKVVTLSAGSVEREGILLGINHQGSLRVDVGGEEQLFVGGEMSLRANA